MCSASCWNQMSAGSGWYSVTVTMVRDIYTCSGCIYTYSTVRTVVCVCCVVYTHNIYTPPTALIFSLYICDGLQEPFQRSKMDDDKAQRTGNTHIAMQLWSLWFDTDDPRCKMTAEYSNHRVYMTFSSPLNICSLYSIHKCVHNCTSMTS